MSHLEDEYYDEEEFDTGQSMENVNEFLKGFYSVPCLNCGKKPTTKTTELFVSGTILRATHTTCTASFDIEFFREDDEDDDFPDECDCTACQVSKVETDYIKSKQDEPTKLTDKEFVDIINLANINNGKHWNAEKGIWE